MAAVALQYYNRYTKTIETEAIYGERWLRFAYDNPVGRLMVWGLAKRKIFSAWYGWRASQRAPQIDPDTGSGEFRMPWQRNSTLRILPFIVKYNIDVDEFAKSPFEYKSFNEFFYRALKPGARPIAEGEKVAVFPADGRHLVFPNIDTAEGFYVKGAKFDLAELLGEDGLPEEKRELTKSFAGGAMIISRLCPVDYHRFHFPCAGIPGEPRLINGVLFSVSPIALRRNINYLVENKRMVTELDSPVFGKVVCMEVGATNVGSIVQTNLPGRAVAKGDEKGLFKFGGSCVITIFQKGKFRFDDDLMAKSREYIETYARMGDRMGVAP
ncbi:MAG: archaetidylserine decarboxylase [Nibricoccus sp.]